LWDVDYINSTKVYAQTVQGLAEYAQKFMFCASWQHPTIRLLLLYSEGLDGARQL